MMKYLIFILFVIVLNGGANVYPFDMNKQQYLSLTNKEKLRSWEKQASVNDALYHHQNQYEPNNKVYDFYTAELGLNNNIKESREEKIKVFLQKQIIKLII